MSHGFLTRSSNGCEIQEPTCMKLDAATDPSGRDHSLGTQGRHWDYCSSLRVGGVCLAQARVINSTGGFPVEDPVGFSDDCLVFHM